MDFIQLLGLWFFFSDGFFPDVFYPALRAIVPLGLYFDFDSFFPMGFSPDGFHPALRAIVPLGLFFGNFENDVIGVSLVCFLFGAKGLVLRRDVGSRYPLL